MCGKPQEIITLMDIRITNTPMITYSANVHRHDASMDGGLMPCPAAVTILLVCLQLKKAVLGFSIVSWDF